MANAMPQLSKDESTFFESRGQDMAPSLLENPEPVAEAEAGGEAAPAAESAGETPAAAAPAQQDPMEQAQIANLNASTMLKGAQVLKTHAQTDSLDQ